MNALFRIRAAGFDVNLCETDKINVSPKSKLTDKHRTFIRRYKTEIIECLKAANDETQHRYAYRFEFDDGDAGTWITGYKPEDAMEALLSRFPGKQIKLLALLN